MAWPISSLTHGSWQWLKSHVGGSMYGKYNAAEWTHEEDGLINSFVQRGVRQFYAPPKLPEHRYAHEWSFLKPTVTLATAASTYTYDLPADFVAFYGPMTYAPDSNVLYEPIKLIAESQIRRMIADEDWTGRPTMAAYRPKTLSASTGTRYELLLYPIPDDAYTLHYRYRVSPSDLSADNPMPYGGPPHYETILASCLALAMPSRDGQFIERLRASISLDQDASAPDSLGIDRDPTDRLSDHTDWHDTSINVVTYNGVEY